MTDHGRHRSGGSLTRPCTPETATAGRVPWWLLDVLATVVLLAVSYVAAVRLEAFDRFAGWLAGYDGQNAGDLAIALTITLLGTTCIGWRRYGRARRQATRLRLAEAELALTNERYRSLFAYHPSAIFSLDRTGRFDSVNEASQRLAGLTRQEFLSVDGFIRVLTPESAAAVTAAFARVLEREPQHVEAALVRPDGTRVELQITGTPIVVDDEVVGVYGIAEDVTFRNRMQRELAQAQARAEQANEAKSLFLANMSHEIRTPLTSIIAVTELLAEDPEPTQRPFLEMMERNGRRLLRLVDDILDFSRIEAGQVTLEPTVIDLPDLVAECLETVRPDADTAGLTLHLTVDERIPDRLVGDGGRIQQVLNNLLGNAVKFTHYGEVGVEVAPLPATGEDAAGVQIRVSDTGIGMEAHQLDGLFDSFSQADPSITRKYGGTGLGLAICQNLVTAMGGRIVVESEVGIGSVFSVELPLQPVGPQAAVV